MQGRHFELTAEIDSPPAHAREAVSAVAPSLGFADILAIIADRQLQRPRFDPQFHVNAAAGGMPDRIVNAFFEDEVHLASQIGSSRTPLVDAVKRRSI